MKPTLSVRLVDLCFGLTGSGSLTGWLLFQPILVDVCFSLLVDVCFSLTGSGPLPG